MRRASSFAKSVNLSLTIGNDYMAASGSCRFAVDIADRIRAKSEDLGCTWLAEIRARETAQDPTQIITSIADYIADPTSPVQLTVPSNERRADAHKTLQDYDTLSEIIYDFAVKELEVVAPPDPGEVVIFAQRLSRAITALQLQHVRQSVAALEGAGELVHEDWLPEADRKKFVGIVLDHVRSLRQMIEGLSHVAADSEDNFSGSAAARAP